MNRYYPYSPYAAGMDELEQTRAKEGPGDLEKLLNGGDVWKV